MRRCRWCGKQRKSFSEWEQEHLKGGWSRLCRPCAQERLVNPYNAILRMRKIGGRN